MSTKRNPDPQGRIVIGFNSDRKLDPPVALRRAREALKVNQIWEAEQLANKLLANDRNCVPAMAILGEVAARTGKIDLAIGLMEKALHKGHTEYAMQVRLVGLYRQTGRLMDAQRFLVGLLKSHPKQPELYLLLGLSRLDQNKCAEALGLFDRGIALNPKDGALFLGRGNALHGLGKIREASASFNRSIALAPNSPQAYVSLAQIMAVGANSKQSASLFKKAYELMPNTSYGNVQMARSLGEEGSVDEAEEFARKAISLDPRNLEAYTTLTGLLQPLGRFAEAKQIILETIARYPNNIGPYFSLSTSHKFTEDDRPLLESMLSLKKTLTIGVTIEQISYAIAKAYADLGEYEDAIKYYDEANFHAKKRLIAFQGEYDPQRTVDFFDRAIEKFTPEFFNQREGFTTDSDRPVFVVGMIRSGTTLTEQILSAHPAITPAGELRFWVERSPMPGNKIEDVMESPEADKLAEDYLALIEGVSADSPRVTDKMPLNFMAVGSIHAIFPNARFIHCTRSPIDNCLSIYMTPYRSGPEYAHDRENIVHFQKQYERLSDHWRKVIPADRFMDVSYENLVANQETVTKQMIEFLGLEWDEACLRPEDNERAVLTPSLWQARQPVYKSSTEKWRKYEPWLGAFQELVKS
jgi:tetratricopeptide (TPR) repeat protein